MAFFIDLKTNKMTKKIFSLTAILFMVVGLVSCEEDDDTTFVSPNYLVGKWVLTEKGTLNAQSVLNYEPADNENCAPDDVTFNADFSFEANSADFDGINCIENAQDGIYEIVPGNIVMNFTDDNPTDEFPAETATLSLRTLTDVEMVLVTTDINDDLVFLKFTKTTE